ncbi:MAG: methyltransferase domain-containing protein [Alphaproteobacteria bacterium]
MQSASQITVFNRALVRERRDRAASRFVSHSALFDEAAEHLIERLQDVKREFTSVLSLGAHDGGLEKHFPKSFFVGTDLSPKLLQAQHAVLADEEFLPFQENSFDLVFSNLNLHWVNDLPGALAQIRHALKPDGFFLASMLGGHTLHELRSCLMEAEMNVTGGVSPRLSPTLDLQTASSLLQRIGFTLPVVDQETITLTYPDVFSLMRDLRGMGETNAHIHRLRVPTRRAVFDEVARLYQAKFAMSDGYIPARFDVVFLHGWKAPIPA